MFVKSDPAAPEAPLEGCTAKHLTAPSTPPTLTKTAACSRVCCSENAYRISLDDWRELDDLLPFVIGQARGYAYESSFDNAVLSRDISAQNPRQLVSMLLAGRIDVIVGDRAQLLYFVREQRAEQSVRILPKPLVQMPRFIAFSKG